MPGCWVGCGSPHLWRSTPAPPLTLSSVFSLRCCWEPVRTATSRSSASFWKGSTEDQPSSVGSRRGSCELEFGPWELLRLGAGGLAGPGYTPESRKGQQNLGKLSADGIHGNWPDVSSLGKQDSPCLEPVNEHPVSRNTQSPGRLSSVLHTHTPEHPHGGS